MLGKNHFVCNWPEALSFDIIVPRWERRFYYWSNEETIENSLLDNVKTEVAFQGKQLRSGFNIKDKIKFPHIQDLVFHTECPGESCNDDYVGETTRCTSERMIDYSGRDKNILKHHIEKEYENFRIWESCPQYENFKIISHGFRNNTKKKKLSEALWIKTLRPTLNKHEKSISLKLFS